MKALYYILPYKNIVILLRFILKRAWAKITSSGYTTELIRKETESEENTIFARFGSSL
jgi:hypothetical protein